MNYTPNAREKLSIVMNNLQMFGAKQTVRDALGFLLTRVSDNFDEKYGVSTVLSSGSTEPLDPGIGDSVSIDNGHGYEPTQERVMRHILDYVGGRLEPREFTFLDLGCGKGRAVLMASELPFREVIGVDLSPELCRVAEQNLGRYFGSRRRWRSGPPLERRAPVSIECADVTRYQYPATDLLVYMFNPFRGAVFRNVLDRLTESRREKPRRVYIALSNPSSEDQLEAHDAFAKLYEFQVIWAGCSWNFWECRG